MPDDPLTTSILQSLVKQIQEGDEALRNAAGNQLFRRCIDRLIVLTRKMLLRFVTPGRVLEDSQDVLQLASMRLLVTLRSLVPNDTRHFYALAAQNIRWVLLDLLEQYKKQPRMLPLSQAGGDNSTLDMQFPSPDDPAELDCWQSFHETVDQLPDVERETFDLRFYQGLTFVQVAELVKVDVSTARQRYQKACIWLRKKLRGDLPPL